MTKAQELRVLIVEDSEDDAFLMIRQLKMAGFAPHYLRVETAEAMVSALSDESWQIILSDYSLPNFSGLSALALVRERSDVLPFILVSGKIGEEQAVDALLLGANDCVMKDNLPRLGPTIRRELQRAEDHHAKEQAIETERQQRERTEALRDTAALLNQTLDVKQIADFVLSTVACVITHDCACVVLIQNGNVKEIFHSCDQENAEVKVHVDGSETFSMCTALPIFECLIVNDTMQDPAWSGFGAISGVRSMISAPLRDNETCLGHIILFSCAPVAFSMRQPSLLTGFADQTAMAVRNAMQLEAITNHRRQLQELSEKIVHAQEEERGRISRELHDEVGQSLTAILINTEYLATILQPNSNFQTPDQASERLSEIRSMAKQTLEQIRGLSLRLRPAMLDDLGLLPTLRWFTDGFAARTGLDVSFDAFGLEDLRFDTVVETTLYRTVQEALTNVSRHARAKTVTIRLEKTPVAIILVVEDDGEGISDFEGSVSDLPSSGIGLLGMRERLSALSGSLEISSRQGEGTRLDVEIPIEDQ